MERTRLSHLNPSFRIEGNTSRRSLELEKVLVSDSPQPSNEVILKLVVLDEKDMPIFSKKLVPDRQQANKAVYIREKFVFYDHLTVLIVAEPEGSAFEAQVEFR